MNERISGRLQNYINDVQSGKEAWNLAFAFPYGQAYEKAFDVFKGALAEQAEVDKRNAELAVFAASVVSGSLLTAALGSTMLVVLRRSALREISRRNLDATYRAARAFGAHPVTVFALGKLLDQAQSANKKLAEDAVRKNLNLLPQRLNDSPGSLRAQLQATLDFQSLTAKDAATAIDRDPSLSENQKDAQFAILRQAPIIVRPSNALSAEKLWPKIALSMFMSHFLDLDQLVDVPKQDMLSEPGGAIGNAIATSKSARPIDLLPSDPNYPRPAQPHFGRVIPAHQAVEIRQPGGKLVSKANELHQTVFNAPFFSRTGFFERPSMSKDELSKAETTLNRLAALTRPNMPHAVVNV